MYIDRINYVKEYLRKNDIDAYIVFISDDHGSEYISDRYKSVRYLSGFTGSAGTLLITKENSYLWTDGRYFLQASNQLKVSNTILKKIGEDESIVEYIKENVNSLVFDLLVFNCWQLSVIGLSAIEFSVNGLSVCGFLTNGES